MYDIEIRSECLRRVTFLVPPKKVTKECGLRGATSKSYIKERLPPAIETFGFAARSTTP